MTSPDVDTLRDSVSAIPPWIGLIVMLGIVVVLGVVTGTHLAEIDPAVNTTVSSDANGTVVLDVQNPEGTLVVAGGWLGSTEYARIEGDGTTRISGLTTGETVNVFLYRDGDWGYVTSLTYSGEAIEPSTASFMIQDKATICYPSAVYQCVGELR